MVCADLSVPRSSFRLPLSSPTVLSNGRALNLSNSLATWFCKSSKPPPRVPITMSPPYLLCGFSGGVLLGLSLSSTSLLPSTKLLLPKLAVKPLSKAA